METLNLAVNCHRVQNDFCESPALFRAFAGGRGSGKSWVGAFDLICRALAAPSGRTYLVASPDGTVLADTTFPMFRQVAGLLGVWDDCEVVRTPWPNVTLPTGSLVRFRSTDQPDKRRGPNLSGAWLDEASLMPRDAYDIVIPALREAGEQGWLSATFTPRGPSHWTHDVFATGKPDTALFKSRTGDNPFNPPGFEATLAAQYGDTQFARQELGGEFVQIEGAEFPAEWFDWPGFWFEAWPTAGIIAHTLYLDPSKGTGDKPAKHDYQAFVRALLVREATAIPGVYDNTFYLDAELVREDISAMVARAARMCKDYRPDWFDFEDNGTLGFMLPEVLRQFEASRVVVPIMPLTNTVPKIQRIRALTGYLNLRQIRIRNTPGGRLLRAQLGDFPLGEWDDGCDAAAGAISRLAELAAGR